MMEVWPPSMPDCSNLDCFVCGVFALKITAKDQHKTKALIQKIKELMGSLDKDTMAKACKMFMVRMDAVVTADGNFII